MTTKYDDIGMEGNELLAKGFPSNSNLKLSFERTSPEGFELKGNVDRQFKDTKETFSLLFEPTFSYTNLKFKSKILNKPEKEVSIEIKDVLTPGSLFEVGTVEKAQSYFGSIGYVNNQLNLNWKLYVPHDYTRPKAEITSNAYAVVNYPNDIFWGVHGSTKKAVKVGSSLIELGLNARIHFVSTGTTIFFDQLLGGNPHQLGLLWNRKISDTVKVASKYTTSTDINVAPTLDAVIEKKTDNGSVLKSKASVSKGKSDLDLKLQFSYASKFSERVSYIFAADMNARQFLGVQGDGMSLGFEVKLK